ncbi:hypothetical protein HGA88_03030 [Candidatus Roizmanbacteria bacterium]|nr:hypothetical protein [Candidatus Roizmanbacteria bacterium]
MNQKELLLLTIGVFLTIVAWMLIDFYHLQTKTETISVKPVPQNLYNIHTDVFTILRGKTE